MKRIFYTLSFAFFMIGIGLQPANATPLAMSYDVTHLGSGLYSYNFTLTLDNHDSSWLPGQSFDWLIFGDANNSISPLGPYNPTNDINLPMDPSVSFVGDPSSLPVGPWSYYTYSFGGHNGPTFLGSNGGWEPALVDQSLTWSGTSHNFVGQGDLLFSTLENYAPGGFNPIDPSLDVFADNGPNFEVAKLTGFTEATPEPATMVLFAIGCGVLFLRRFRRKILI